MSSDMFPKADDLFADKKLRFYLTSPLECPYLPDRYERKLFTTLNDLDAHYLNETLTRAGFRRSQNIAYRPACDMCTECVSIRVLVKDFKFNKNWRRVLKIGKYIDAQSNFPDANEERYALIKKYLNTRHLNEGMSDMDGEDFIAMLEECTSYTRIIDYRLNQDCEYGKKGQLIACLLLDELNDGKSLVYSFYEPDLQKHSIGTYIILHQINDTRQSERDYLYLGYLIKDCRKMAYKSRFTPYERLGPRGWERQDNVAK